MGKQQKGRFAKKSTARSNKKSVSIPGSIGLQDSLQLNPERERYDENGKKILKHKEVLATILKYTVKDYKDCTMDEVLACIDLNSIDQNEPIAPDSDTRIKGDPTEESSVNEARITFDQRFRARLPVNTRFHLHVDVELQGNYYPGYALEKRGIYHMARMISSQLEVINRTTNYGKLEKVCSIFICVGNVPKRLWNTVSYYQFSNTNNVGEIVVNKRSYDLMDLIIIRLGDLTSENDVDIIRFLHGIFYSVPEELTEYIDFSKNEEFRREVKELGLTGEHLLGNTRREYEKKIKEKDKALEEKDIALEEKNKALEEKDKDMQEQEKIIRTLQEENKRLRALADMNPDQIPPTELPK
ncbi:MAG: hypothetical protein PHY47_26255 [Lachnospiraceae bacterium]|nr:hypothetical protein [Lachnospiraceae bacterium]